LVGRCATLPAGVLIFCIAFGIMIGTMGERSRVMCEFFSELNEVVMRIVGIVMWYALLDRRIGIPRGNARGIPRGRESRGNGNKVSLRERRDDKPR